ncbi:MAG: leucine--tRNA ligase [Anaerolineae bacterium]|nr:leucine--tRNA ligase [Anaerolineae bacterium]
MAEKYVPKKIEPKWQKRWENDRLYRSEVDWNRPKHYAMTMLPYPSGDLHIGHWFAMTPSDARARFMRMRGYNVMFPIGFDAFGLPAEQAAISRNIHPKTWTYNNITRMQRQLRSMGAMFDWEREAISCDPGYYRWTEWFFKQFFENDLAYRGEALVNWSPTLQTVLANEQVIDGKDERTGQPVIQKLMEQWFFRITKYADELLNFDNLNWPEPIRIMQTNWIGRSEGAHVTFTTEHGDPIKVFTTRPDTLWGATFMVLAPEHALVGKITTGEQCAGVENYVEQAARATEIERTAEGRDKTGVFTGAYAINPVNQARIPIWIADYVMITYGSGAIMAVPAHDQRDFDFALKFGLPIIPVIARNDGLTRSYTRLGAWVTDGFTSALDKAAIPHQVDGSDVYVTPDIDQVDAYAAIVQQYLKPGAWTEIVGGAWLFVFKDAVMPFDSLGSEQRILERCRALEPAVADKRTVMEMLYGVEWYRDALYHDAYGTMINSGEFTGTPGIKTDDNGEQQRYAKQAVSHWLEKQGIGQATVNYRLRDWLISRQRYWGAPIPVVFTDGGTIEAVPEDQLPVELPEDVQFMPTGQSPLLFHDGFLNTTASDGSPAKRETDTMDTFMCSSWYQYRYLSPDYDQAPFDPDEGAYWLPVDVYTGGAEHATLHLLYTRFFTKAMRDLGVFDDAAAIAGKNGRNPDELINEPMTVLRNQGQILGEERRGDVIEAAGRADGEKLFADHVKVIDPSTPRVNEPDRIVGEIMRRTEDVLRVDTGDGNQRTVEITSGAVVDIPAIPGKNDVNQLKHHLEIQRMSKSKGNVVDPDELVAQYGADTVRGYLMFAFDWQKGGPWDSQGIQGVVRWLSDVWGLFAEPTADAPGEASAVETTAVEATGDDIATLRRKVHQAIKRVTDSLETFSFNTAIAALMSLKNTLQTMQQTPVIHSDAWDEARNIYLRLMAPFAPHIAEELWGRHGYGYSVHLQSWPEYDEEAAAEQTITLVIQVNGKVRDRIDVPADISEEEAKKLALESESVLRHMSGKAPRNVIYVGERGMINIVV